MGKRWFNKVTGVTKAKRRVAKYTGIPTTRGGRRGKVGRMSGCLVYLLAVVSVAPMIACGGGKQADPPQQVVLTPTPVAEQVASSAEPTPALPNHQQKTQPKAQPQRVASPPTARPAPPKSSEPDWAAPDAISQQGPITVQIRRAYVGRVPLTFHIQNGIFGKAATDQEHTVFVLDVLNASSTAKVDFRAWQTYGSASLTDGLGNTYKRTSFRLDNRYPEGGYENQITLYPGKSVSQVLAFEVPVPAARSLDLVLPASNYASPGDIRFRVPIDFFKGSASDTSPTYLMPAKAGFERSQLGDRWVDVRRAVRAKVQGRDILVCNLVVSGPDTKAWAAAWRSADGAYVTPLSLVNKRLANAPSSSRRRSMAKVPPAVDTHVDGEISLAFDAEGMGDFALRLPVPEVRGSPQAAFAFRGELGSRTSAKLPPALSKDRPLVPAIGGEIVFESTKLEPVPVDTPQPAKLPATRIVPVVVAGKPDPVPGGPSTIAVERYEEAVEVEVIAGRKLDLAELARKASVTLIEAPTAVTVERTAGGWSYLRPAEGEFKGRFLVVRAERVFEGAKK